MRADGSNVRRPKLRANIPDTLLVKQECLIWLRTSPAGTVVTESTKSKKWRKRFHDICCSQPPFPNDSDPIVAVMKVPYLHLLPISPLSHTTSTLCCLLSLTGDSSWRPTAVHNHHGDAVGAGRPPEGASGALHHSALHQGQGRQAKRVQSRVAPTQALLCAQHCQQALLQGS